MRQQVPLLLVFVFGMFMVVQYFIPHENSERAKGFLLNWVTIIGVFALALGIWSLIRVTFDKISGREENWQYSIITLVGLTAMMFFGWTSHEPGQWLSYFIALVVLLAALWMLARTFLGSRRGGGISAKRSGIFAITLFVIFGLFAAFDNSWTFYFYTSQGLSNQMFVNFFDFILIPIQSTMFSLLAFFIASAAYRAFRARNLLASLLLFAALIVMLRFTPGPWGDYLAKSSTWLMNVPNLAAQRAIVMGIGLGIVATALKVLLGIERGYMGKG